MSAIFGLIQLDGRPVEPADIERMAAAAAAFGPDGGGIWLGGPAGLGQLQLNSTPEGAHEPMPYVAPAADLAFTAAGRLDNRDELLAALGVTPADGRQLADGALMLRAYQRWGEECVTRLEGDWALAAWHPQRRRLVLARDQFGITGSYYYVDGERLAFAPSLPALLALPCVPRRLNELQLARLLTAFPDDGDVTLYQGIMRLPPAHLLVLEAGRPRVRRYWRMEDAPEVRLGSDAAYVEAFLEQYERAVRVRLRAARPLATTLSAGLDSGSVSALAARALRERGEALMALTAVPLYHADDLVGSTTLASEWARAHATAQLAGIEQHVAINAASSSPLAALDWTQQILAEPQHAAGNMHWLTALQAEARRRGAGVLLTGQVGNGGVSWAGAGYRAFMLLQGGQPFAALRALDRWRSDSGRSWAGALKSQLGRPLLGTLQAGATPLLVAAGRPPWGDYAPISPQLARRSGLLQQMRVEGHDPTYRRPRDEREQRIALIRPASNPVGAIWHTMGAQFGLEVRDPTADIRLLRFCLGLPDEQYRRGSQSRLLIRRAMGGLLPEAVLRADRFGRQGADIGRRLLAEGAALEARLLRLERSPELGAFLDLPAMRRCWEALQRSPGPETNTRASTLLLRGLGAGSFLLTFL